MAALTNEQKAEFLELLDDILSGCEKCITQPDDPSGLLTEWVLDTEKVRDRIQAKVRDLRKD